MSSNSGRLLSEWDGVFAFPITPMNDAGAELDLRSYREHLDRLIDAGVHGLMPLGSTGEFAYLSPEEREQVIATTVDQVAGRVPIIAGASAITTRDTVSYARQAEALGANGVLVVLQSYFTLSPDEIVRHFERISDAISLPIFIYNNPATSKHDVKVELLKRLLELPNITGLKESTGGLDRVMELQWQFGDRLVLHCGFEHLALPMFSLGIRGWSTATANLIPEQCVRLYRLAVEERDFQAALEIHHSIAPLAKFILSVPLPSAVKTGLSLLGSPVGAPRPPLSPLGAPAQKILAQLLEQARAAPESPRASRQAVPAETA